MVLLPSLNPAPDKPAREDAHPTKTSKLYCNLKGATDREWLLFALTRRAVRSSHAGVPDRETIGNLMTGTP